MQFGVLITHGGRHTPEKWASAAAERIVSVAQTLEGERLIAAQKLQLAVTEILEKHHADAQGDVQGSLASGNHYDPDVHPVFFKHDPGPRLDQAVTDIQTAAAGTPWEAHFQHAETVEKLRHAVGQSLVDLAHVERLWHADENAGDASAQAYKAFHVGGA
jgi:hypothetical protein